MGWTSGGISRALRDPGDEPTTLYPGPVTTAASASLSKRLGGEIALLVGKQRLREPGERLVHNKEPVPTSRQGVEYTADRPLAARGVAAGLD